MTDYELLWNILRAVAYVLAVAIMVSILLTINKDDPL